MNFDGWNATWTPDQGTQGYQFRSDDMDQINYCKPRPSSVPQRDPVQSETEMP